jgi:hypothetical protein
MKALFKVAAAAVVGLCSQSVFAKGCCLPNGTCINTTEGDCLYQGGIFFVSMECGDPNLNCSGSGCRMTGGGNDTFGNWNGTFCDGHQRRGNQTERYTFGGQAGAPTASQPQPYGEWTHHQQSGPSGDFVFHAGTASSPAETEIDLVTCSDPGFCRPARPAPDKQLDFEGVGQFHNIRNPSSALSGVVAGQTLHWFEVHIEDLGEPGRNGRQGSPSGFCPDAGSAGAIGDCRCPDFYHITIHANQDPGSTVIYDVYGYIDGGNLQIHPPIH